MYVSTPETTLEKLVLQKVVLEIFLSDIAPGHACTVYLFFFICVHFAHEGPPCFRQVALFVGMEHPFLHSSPVHSIFKIHLKIIFLSEVSWLS